jgi:hypothetical protein
MLWRCLSRTVRGQVIQIITDTDRTDMDLSGVSEVILNILPISSIKNVRILYIGKSRL